jgi:ATP-dependent helicase HrpA
VRDTPRDWLAQYPRYIKALRVRMQRHAGQVAKDLQYTQLMDTVGSKLASAGAERPGLLQLCSEAQRYRWMLEEFRVSLFAQSLGTRAAISQKRLEEQWQKVDKWLEQNPR